MRRIFTTSDVARLRHGEVAKTGGQSALAKQTGIQQSLINRVLRAEAYKVDRRGHRKVCGGQFIGTLEPLPV
jgi:hypothetical protein